MQSWHRPGVCLAQVAAVSGLGPSRCGVHGGWIRMFTLSPAGIPAGPVLDLVLLLFISPLGVMGHPALFS